MDLTETVQQNSENPAIGALTAEERADRALQLAQQKHEQMRTRRPDQSPVGTRLVEILGDRLNGQVPDLESAAARIQVRREIDELARQAVDDDESEGAAPPPPPIPRKHAAAGFANYQPVTESQRAALEAVKAFVRRAADDEGAQLALIGPTGVGKSHLLYAAARVLHAAGRRVYTRGWYTLADELRYGGRHPWTGVKLEPGEVRALIREQGIILLDEVRPTAGTDFDDNELTKIAAHAWAECIPLLITTNSNPLTNVMTAPAASRFTQVVVTGPDHRQAR